MPRPHVRAPRKKKHLKSHGLFDATREQIQEARRERKKRGEKLVDVFKQGDLLYGLRKKTGPYYYKLVNRGFTYITAAEMNKLHDHFLLNSRAHGDFSIFSNPDTSETHRNHYQFLSDNRHYLFRPGGKDFTHSDNVETKIINIATARACKALLRDAKVQGRTIHYCLDGINHERVCSKLDQGQIDTSLSSAELRMLFRQRYRLLGNVFFYRNGCQVEAPWDDQKTRHLYERYEETRVLKVERMHRATVDTTDHAGSEKADCDTQTFIGPLLPII